MALNARVVGLDVIHPRRIENALARILFHVNAAGAVAALTADVPLGNLFSLDIEIR